jgi:hypothetical protein
VKDLGIHKGKHKKHVTVKEFRKIKLECLNGKNKDKIVVPWDYDKCFLQYNASDENAASKEELFYCW